MTALLTEDSTTEVVASSDNATAVKSSERAKGKDAQLEICSRLIEQIEQGVLPWKIPWNAKSALGSPSRPLRSNGKRYSGVNVIELWSQAHKKSYIQPTWFTYRQAKELGGQVKKGEEGTQVFYSSEFEKTVIDDKTGEPFKQSIHFLKMYYVFNTEQISGLPEHFYAREQQAINLDSRLDHAEAFFKATKFDIRTGGNQACYVQGLDFIRMPPYEYFENRNQFYSTLGHESIHYAASRIMPNGLISR